VVVLLVAVSLFWFPAELLSLLALISQFLYLFIYTSRYYITFFSKWNKYWGHLIMQQLLITIIIIIIKKLENSVHVSLYRLYGVYFVKQLLKSKKL